MQLRAVVGSLLLLVGCSKPEKAAERNGSAAPVHVAPEARLEEALKAPIPEMPALSEVLTCRSKNPQAVVPRTKRPNQPWELPFELTECPTVPSVYGTATFGMDAAAAQAAMPGAKLDGSIAYVYVGEHPLLQHFGVTFDARGRTQQFSFQVDAEGFAALKAAWGEPLLQTRYGAKIHAWFNPAARIKARAVERRWHRMNPKTEKFEDVPAYWVELVEYMPLVELLGPAGIVGKPLLGKTVEEIVRTYPELVAPDPDRLERDDSAPAEAPRYMRVPEIETGEHQTLVFGTWVDGKLDGYWFKIPYGKDDKLKRELLAQVAAALGTPIEARKGEYTFKTPNGLFVDLELGFSKDEWELKVRAK